MNIEFIPSSKDHELCTIPPKPSKLYIPEWYKKTESFPKKLKFDDGGVPENLGIKQCIPFLDGLGSGYIQETHCDLYFDFESDTFEYFYSLKPQIISHRSKHHLPIENDFYPIEFVWKMPWIPKLPKGYSLLLTHPLNRIDLPFFTTSAVIDSDRFYHSSQGNYPFYIKKNFSGIIPAGTPMYQMIPIKRNNWKSKLHKFDKNVFKKRNAMVQRKMFGGYKKEFWQKKEYS